MRASREGVARPARPRGPLHVPAMKHSILFTTSLTLLAACAADPYGPRGADAKQELDAIDARHSAEKSALERAQADFAKRWKAPFTLEFGDQGTIEVGDCALQGYDEHVELHLLYTYVNTTGRPIRGVRIVVELVDPDTHAALANEARLSFPPMFPFAPESSYTTAANVATRGVHLKPGWEWRIRPQVLSKLGG